MAENLVETHFRLPVIELLSFEGLKLSTVVKISNLFNSSVQLEPSFDTGQRITELFVKREEEKITAF